MKHAWRKDARSPANAVAVRATARRRAAFAASNGLPMVGAQPAAQRSSSSPPAPAVGGGGAGRLGQPSALGATAAASTTPGQRSACARCLPAGHGLRNGFPGGRLGNAGCDCGPAAARLRSCRLHPANHPAPLAAPPLQAAALIGAVVTGVLARRRREEMEGLNGKLRQINTELRRQRCGAAAAQEAGLVPQLCQASLRCVTLHSSAQLCLPPCLRWFAAGVALHNLQLQGGPGNHPLCCGPGGSRGPARQQRGRRRQHRAGGRSTGGAAAAGGALARRCDRLLCWQLPS